MEAIPTATELIRFLASTHRVVVLGGLAVISHGLSRVTYDADCWLEPSLSTELWCEAVKKILLKWPQLRLLPDFREFCFQRVIELKKER